MTCTATTRSAGDRRMCCSTHDFAAPCRRCTHACWRKVVYAQVQPASHLMEFAYPSNILLLCRIDIVFCLKAYAHMLLSLHKSVALNTNASTVKTSYRHPSEGSQN